MKTIGNLLGMCTLLVLIGCTRSQPGGGAQRADQFTINGPPMTVTIPEGEAHTISLNVSRGSEFKQDVKLEVEAPAGVKVAPKETTVKASQKGEVDLQVAVGKNVTPGEHIIHVTGKPDNGSPTILNIKINVTEKSENVQLKLRGPATTTTVKQGETRTVKIDVEPNAKFHSSVRLEAAPAGLRAEFSSNNATIKAMEGSESDLRITADKNASLGEHTIRVMGTADGATVKAAEVKVKVVAP